MIRRTFAFLQLVWALAGQLRAMPPVHWTKDDEDALRHFYNTPIGKKFIITLQQSVIDANDWTGNVVTNYQHAVGYARGWKAAIQYVLKLSPVPAYGDTNTGATPTSGNSETAAEVRDADFENQHAP